jgi:hypothetical protein
MPVVASTRGFLSNVLWDSDENDTFTESYAQVNVRTTSGTITKSALGIPVIWDNALTAFRPVADGDTIPATASTLPNAAPVGIVVGIASGLGDDKADVSLTTTPKPLTVLFRSAAVVKEGINYETAVQAATKAVFETQLEKQFIVVRPKSTAITQSFVA